LKQVVKVYFEKNTISFLEGPGPSFTLEKVKLGGSGPSLKISFCTKRNHTLKLKLRLRDNNEISLNHRQEQDITKSQVLDQQSRQQT